MTESELQATQAAVNEYETVAAELRRTVGEGIEAARAINAKVRSEQMQLRGIDQKLGVLRGELSKHAQAEAARLAAEAKAKADEAVKV